MNKALPYPKQTILAALIFLTGAANAEIVADARRDFEPRATPPGWSYYWNPTGADINDQSSYEPLIQYKDKWRFVTKSVENTPDSTQDPNGRWLKINTKNKDEILLTPGKEAKKSTDQTDHYAICAYTIQTGEAGNGAIKESKIKRILAKGSGEIRIYVNEKLIASETVEGNTAYSFDTPLGQLNVGDTIYIAYGPKTDNSGAALRWKINTE